VRAAIGILSQTQDSGRPLKKQKGSLRSCSAPIAIPIKFQKNKKREPRKRYFFSLFSLVATY
jgi:hypothetical protein